ncbi:MULTISPECIES: homoserine O-succinyltransferase [Pseudoalteromonas]|uniref:Homoserine O-succinyltransferase n=1 Tax=Pseudoalteromonas luteoviolacea (strain 2ta16) TaxID=1353533 RepID=V4HXA3_PSEL2|nr:MULTISPECIES: homoserine O-succinyltransferase [Pseudoalteromonas]ESP95445.1 homoserine O-succinyltransferase [Pseudoalteromonas luteoviolacea 2ta16]MCG7548420.1 homoserine O-succinyltransferase [Pseudoalteromonas sp. Of7M-16]
MPITVKDELPAIARLRHENVFVMPKSRAMSQEIRPMRLAILNLMPNKVETEVQFIRLLANTPLQVNVDLLRLDTHRSSENSEQHLNMFYRYFSEVKEENYDALIVTGAPLAHLEYSDVIYWQELQAFFDWAEHHVTSTLFSCWAAHAGLYHHHGLKRELKEQKLCGVFKHRVYFDHGALTRGFDDEFLVPHSRYGHIDIEKINRKEDLVVLAGSEQVGAYLLKNNTGSQVYITGHPEYDADTLQKEYLRDLQNGPDAPMPDNYFPNNDSGVKPSKTWQSHAFLLFSNWLNYYVYQTTPYDINLVSQDVRTNNYAE